MIRLRKSANDMIRCNQEMIAELLSFEYLH